MARGVTEYGDGCSPPEGAPRRGAVGRGGGSGNSSPERHRALRVVFQRTGGALEIVPAEVLTLQHRVACSCTTGTVEVLTLIDPGQGGHRGHERGVTHTGHDFALTARNHPEEDQRVKSERSSHRAASLCPPIRAVKARVAATPTGNR